MITWESNASGNRDVFLDRIDTKERMGDWSCEVPTLDNPGFARVESQPREEESQSLGRPLKRRTAPEEGFPARRKKIDVGGTVQNLVVTMSEGNVGAISVIRQVLESSPMDGFMRLLDLDDMNMRGPQIWVGFKNHCEGGIDVFLEAVKNRDPELARPSMLAARTVGTSLEDRRLELRSSHVDNVKDTKTFGGRVRRPVTRLSNRSARVGRSIGLRRTRLR